MKYLLCLGLALGLIFAVSAVSLAVPVVGAEGGQLVVFADRDWWADNIGAGYGISDEITLGVVYDMTNETYGAFANLTFNQLAVQAENWFVHGNNLSTVTGLWNFDLDPFTLGLGGGLDFGPAYDNFFLSVAADMAISENLSLYGSVRYFPDENTYNNKYCYKVGMVLEF